MATPPAPTWSRRSRSRPPRRPPRRPPWPTSRPRRPPRPRRPTTEKADEPEKAELPQGAKAPLKSGGAPKGFEVKGNADSGLYHEPDGQWYDQTDAEFYFKTAEDAEAAGFTRAGGGAAADEEDEVSTLHKDHRDVLIAPVVSEKSYGLLDANKYTFLVRPDANKTEIKIAVEKVFNVKVTVGQHHQPRGQDAPYPHRARQAQGHQARDRQPRRGPPHRHLRRSGLLTGLLENRD